MDRERGQRPRPPVNRQLPARCIRRSNAPRHLAELCDAFFAGDLPRAQAAQIKFAPLVKAMFLETNPLPVKHALAKMGRIAPELRLPLAPLSEAAAPKVEAALKAYGGLM